MIVSFVNSLMHGKDFDAMVRRFAKSHAKYKLTLHHFLGFGSALVLTVQKRLGKLATIPLVQIWRKCMESLIEKMWKAYQRAAKKAGTDV
mmetsp:Transcript_21681/g.40613  ORF Transcript_21681/g.40613 Transcript_21681/m.40613 type:complete len:90 (+) Transcript_21681:358-627(+)